MEGILRKFPGLHLMNMTFLFQPYLQPASASNTANNDLHGNESLRIQELLSHLRYKKVKKVKLSQ
jgi:hypothetical protein